MAAFNSGMMIIFMNYLVQHWGATWSTIIAAMVLSLVLGAVGGLVNGLVITRGKIESFIVTLGTMGIFRSLVTYLADGGTLSLNLPVRGLYRPVYYGTFLKIPIPLIIFFIVAVVGAVLMYKTRFGRYVLAIGSNYDVAHYSAINVNRIRVLTYILQGICVAIATIIYVPRLGSASGSTGYGWELEAIAAVIIGGTAMKGGTAKILGTVAGAIIFSIIGNILNLSDAINDTNGAVQGLIIIGAVLVQRTSKNEASGRGVCTGSVGSLWSSWRKGKHKNTRKANAQNRRTIVVLTVLSLVMLLVGPAALAQDKSDRGVHPFGDPRLDGGINCGPE